MSSNSTPLILGNIWPTFEVGNEAPLTLAFQSLLAPFFIPQIRDYGGYRQSDLHYVSRDYINIFIGSGAQSPQSQKDTYKEAIRQFYKESQKRKFLDRPGFSQIPQLTFTSPLNPTFLKQTDNKQGWTFLCKSRDGDSPLPPLI